jgi:hypothetical protein
MATQAKFTFIIVEKSTKSQNAFRRFFESLGFRVLVSASPARALATAESSKIAVDGLIMSSLELGDEAVVAFNSLSDPASSAKLPAVLIVNKKNTAIVEAARCDDYRKVIFIPMNVSSVISTISMVLRKDSQAELSAEDGVKNIDDAKGVQQDRNATTRFVSPVLDAPYFDDDMPMPD